MTKELRCKNCGESITADGLLKDENGDFVFCPTCEGTKFIVIGSENEEIDTLDIEEEEEDMVVECTCIHCGDDFEAETLVEAEREVCPECQEVLEYAENEDLIIALAEEFGCAVKDIVENSSTEYQIDGIEYKVLTEEQADEEMVEYVEETLWAFNPSFLADVTDMPIEVFEVLCEKCEGGNEDIRSIVDKTCGIEELAEEAVRWDGRGHFLNSYDGGEIEISVDGELFYCYRY